MGQRPTTGQVEGAWGGGCLQAVGLIYGLGWLLLAAIQWWLPGRDGVLGLSRVAAPYLWLPLILFLPGAMGRGRLATWLRVILAASALVAALWFPPRLRRAAEAPGGGFSALTWNLRLAGAESPAVRQHLLEQGADIVALQECAWHAPLEDPALVARYPYRLADQGQALPPGIRLLSVYPIVDHGVINAPDGLWDIPRILWARLALADGRELIVVTAHPRPPAVYWPGLGVFYTHQRDGQLGALRQVVAFWRERGYAVLVMGDLNLTEREPAYGELLSEGLNDAHRAVGRGWGHTWRVGPLPALRIDYMLASEPLVPLDITVNRQVFVSDHDSVFASFVW